MITAEIRNKFNKLQSERNLNGIIEYLSDILKHTDNDNLIDGFCFWNISDSYAMLRKSNELYANHMKFREFLSGIPEKYALWAVCDATQRFTLELGGYGEFWRESYKNAIQANTDIDGIEAIMFATHKAALSLNPKIKENLYNLQFARNCFSDFILKLENTENIKFYKLVYASLCLKAFGEEEYDIINLSYSFLPLLKEKDMDCQYSLGEWERLNGKRSKRSMARVGLNHAVNAFIDTGKKALAKDLYNNALKNGLPTNSYIEKRL